MGLLWKIAPPPFEWRLRAPFETWSERVARHFGLTRTGTADAPIWEGATSYMNRKRMEKRKAFDIPMLFFSATNQKRMGGKAVYVGAIDQKIKMATRLVVLRGAKVEDEEHKETLYSKVVLDEEEVRKMEGRGGLCLVRLLFKGMAGVYVFCTYRLVVRVLPDNGSISYAISRPYQLYTRRSAFYVYKGICDGAGVA